MPVARDWQLLLSPIRGLNLSLVRVSLQEAFRSVEDIHGLMLLATKAPKAQLMAVYYTKLVKVFWMGGGECKVTSRALKVLVSCVPR